jgi:hypothetical protein
VIFDRAISTPFGQPGVFNDAAWWFARDLDDVFADAEALCAR